MFGLDTEEAVIQSLVYTSATDSTTLTLGAAIQFTHLGEVVSIVGDTRGQSVDMRAEVRETPFDCWLALDICTVGLTDLHPQTHGLHSKAALLGCACLTVQLMQQILLAGFGQWSVTVPSAPQVAVLTRNVVFEGDETSASYAHGATIMIHTHGEHPRAIARVEQVSSTRLH